MLLTLFYILIAVCLIYPPAEFVSAGFTIPQLFSSVLGSENVNFIEYHMRRIALTIFVESFLPMGLIFVIWFTGANSPWLVYAAIVTAVLPLVAVYRINKWWLGNKKNHPVVVTLKHYIPDEGDWTTVALDINSEFRSIDKVVIALSATSKFVATENWLIKVEQYKLYIIKQEHAVLVATDTDTHNLNPSGQDEIQYVKILVIPSSNIIKRFSFRITISILRELQTRLLQPVLVPDSLTLQAPLIERFLVVFKQHVDENPVYFIDQNQELEACIGCMQTEADVKIQKLCTSATEINQEEAGVDDEERRTCQDCNCRVLWCCSCMGRWWAARAEDPSKWLSAKGSCPLCRAVFCMLDICPVQRR